MSSCDSTELHALLSALLLCPMIESYSLQLMMLSSVKAEAALNLNPTSAIRMSELCVRKGA
jgi:hypothetical protein